MKNKDFKVGDVLSPADFRYLPVGAILGKMHSNQAIFEKVSSDSFKRLRNGRDVPIGKLLYRRKIYWLPEPDDLTEEGEDGFEWE